jgi:hypothetical protein
VPIVEGQKVIWIADIKIVRLDGSQLDLGIAELASGGGWFAVNGMHYELESVSRVENLLRQAEKEVIIGSALPHLW